MIPEETQQDPYAAFLSANRVAQAQGEEPAKQQVCLLLWPNDPQKQRGYRLQAGATLLSRLSSNETEEQRLATWQQQQLQLAEHVILIKDLSLSLQHALINVSHTANGKPLVFIQDLGSRNHTWLDTDGELVQAQAQVRYAVKLGQQLRLGSIPAVVEPCAPDQRPGGPEAADVQGNGVAAPDPGAPAPGFDLDRFLGTPSNSHLSRSSSDVTQGQVDGQGKEHEGGGEVTSPASNPSQPLPEAPAGIHPREGPAHGQLEPQPAGNGIHASPGQPLPFSDPNQLPGDPPVAGRSHPQPAADAQVAGDADDETQAPPGAGPASGLGKDSSRAPSSLPQDSDVTQMSEDITQPSNDITQEGEVMQTEEVQGKQTLGTGEGAGQGNPPALTLRHGDAQGAGGQPTGGEQAMGRATASPAAAAAAAAGGGGEPTGARPSPPGPSAHSEVLLQTQAVPGTVPLMSGGSQPPAHCQEPHGIPAHQLRQSQQAVGGTATVPVSPAEQGTGTVAQPEPHATPTQEPAPRSPPPAAGGTAQEEQPEKIEPQASPPSQHLSLQLGAAEPAAAPAPAPGPTSPALRLFSPLQQQLPSPSSDSKARRCPISVFQEVMAGISPTSHSKPSQKTKLQESHETQVGPSAGLPQPYPGTAEEQPQQQQHQQQQQSVQDGGGAEEVVAGAAERDQQGPQEGAGVRDAGAGAHPQDAVPMFKAPSQKEGSLDQAVRSQHLGSFALGSGSAPSLGQTQAMELAFAAAGRLVAGLAAGLAAGDVSTGHAPRGSASSEAVGQPSEVANHTGATISAAQRTMTHDAGMQHGPVQPGEPAVESPFAEAGQQEKGQQKQEKDQPPVPTSSWQQGDPGAAGPLQPQGSTSPTMRTPGGSRLRPGQETQFAADALDFLAASSPVSGVAAQRNAAEGLAGMHAARALQGAQTRQGRGKQGATGAAGGRGARRQPAPSRMRGVTFAAGAGPVDDGGPVGSKPEEAEEQQEEEQDGASAKQVRAKKGAGNSRGKGGSTVRGRGRGQAQSTRAPAKRKRGQVEVEEQEVQGPPAAQQEEGEDQVSHHDAEPADPAAQRTKRAKLVAPVDVPPATASGRRSRGGTQAAQAQEGGGATEIHQPAPQQPAARGKRKRGSTPSADDDGIEEPVEPAPVGRRSRASAKAALPVVPASNTTHQGAAGDSNEPGHRPSHAPPDAGIQAGSPAFEGHTPHFTGGTRARSRTRQRASGSRLLALPFTVTKAAPPSSAGAGSPPLQQGAPAPPHGNGEVPATAHGQHADAVQAPTSAALPLPLPLPLPAVKQEPATQGEGQAGTGVQHTDPVQQDQEQPPEPGQAAASGGQDDPGAGKASRRSGRAAKRAAGTQRATGVSHSRGHSQETKHEATAGRHAQTAHAQTAATTGTEHPTVGRHQEAEPQLPPESPPAASAATTGARASKRRKHQQVKSPGIDTASLADAGDAPGAQGAPPPASNHALRRRSAAAARQSPAPAEASPAPGPVVMFSSVGAAEIKRYRALVQRLGGSVPEEEGGTAAQAAGKGPGRQGASASAATQVGRRGQSAPLVEEEGSQAGPHPQLRCTIKGSLAPYTHLVVGEFVRSSKQLQALSLGAYLVNSAWLDACKAAGTWMEVRREHTDMGRTAANKWGPNLDLWGAHTRRQEQGPLLQGVGVVLLPGLVKKEGDSGVKTLGDLVAAAGGQVLVTPQQRALAEAWLKEHICEDKKPRAPSAPTSGKGGGRKSRGGGGAVDPPAGSGGAGHTSSFTDVLVLGSEDDKWRPCLSLPAGCGVRVYERELLMRCLVRQQRLDKDQAAARGLVLFTL